MENVPIDKVHEFEALFIQLLEAKYRKEVLDEIKAGNLTDDIQAKIRECASEISSRYK